MGGCRGLNQALDHGCMSASRFVGAKTTKKKTRRNTRKLLIEGHHILIKGIRTIYDGEGLFRIFYKEAGFLKMVQTGSYANSFSFFF